MRLYYDQCIFEINFRELFDSRRTSLKYEMDRLIRLYGFTVNHYDIDKYKITTENNIDRTLSEWILIFNNMVTFLEENKILWIPGKCPFNEGNKCGFLLLKKTYLIVVIISDIGITSTKEYPLGNNKKLL